MASDSLLDPLVEGVPTTHHFYNAADADFIIRVNDISSPDTIIDFRVHKAKLAAASPVFADMFTLGEGVKEQSDILPMVGEIRVWELLLPSVYNDSTRFEDFNGVLTTAIISLWKEAHKYDMVTLYHYAEQCLLTDLRSCAGDTAIEIYAEALNRQRKFLARAALARVEECGYKDLSLRGLAMLPSMELAMLMSKLFDADARKVSEAKKKLNSIGPRSESEWVFDQVEAAKTWLNEIWSP